jgi:hypothetical protein
LFIGKGVGCGFFNNQGLASYEGFCTGTAAGTAIPDAASYNYGTC